MAQSRASNGNRAAAEPKVVARNLVGNVHHKRSQGGAAVKCAGGPQDSNEHLLYDIFKRLVPNVWRECSHMLSYRINIVREQRVHRCCIVTGDSARERHFIIGSVHEANSTANVGGVCLGCTMAKLPTCGLGMIASIYYGSQFKVASGRHMIERQHGSPNRRDNLTPPPLRFDFA